MSIKLNVVSVAFESFGKHFDSLKIPLDAAILHHNVPGSTEQNPNTKESEEKLVVFVGLVLAVGYELSVGKAMPDIAKKFFGEDQIRAVAPEILDEDYDNGITAQEISPKGRYNAQIKLDEDRNTLLHIIRESLANNSFEARQKAIRTMRTISRDHDLDARVLSEVCRIFKRASLTGSNHNMDFYAENFLFKAFNISQSANKAMIPDYADVQQSIDYIVAS